MGKALTRLLGAMGVEATKLDPGEPLGPGLPSTVKLTNGRFSCDRTEPNIPELADLEFQLTGGSISRAADGNIVADIQSRAPNTKLQQINELMGFAEIKCVSVDSEISQSADKPSRFVSSRHYVMRRGTTIPPMFGNPALDLPFDVPAQIDWVASGYISGDQFIGTYDAVTQYPSLSVAVKMQGRFELGFAPAFGV